MMIRLPDGRDGGRRVSEPAALLDVLPTLIEAAGREAPADVRGVSWWGHLTRGEESPVDLDRVIFSEGVWRVVSATNGRDGLVFSGISAHSPLLSQGMISAALPGPAFDAWRGTDSETQARLAQAMMDWRERLPASPGGGQPLSEERRRILQQQGYWGMD